MGNPNKPPTNRPGVAFTPAEKEIIGAIVANSALPETLTQEGADVVQSLWRAAQARGVPWVWSDGVMPFKTARITFLPDDPDAMEPVRALVDSQIALGWRGVGVITSMDTRSLYVVFERAR